MTGPSSSMATKELPLLISVTESESEAKSLSPSVILVSRTSFSVLLPVSSMLICSSKTDGFSDAAVIDGEELLDRDLGQSRIARVGQADAEGDIVIATAPIAPLAPGMRPSTTPGLTSTR